MAAENDPVIKQFREKISDNDLKVVDLLNKRIKLVTQLWQYKRQHDMDVYAPAQEDWLLTYVTRANNGPLSGDALHEIYRHIIEVTQHEARARARPRRGRSPRALAGGPPRLRQPLTLQKAPPPGAAAPLRQAPPPGLDRLATTSGKPRPRRHAKSCCGRMTP